jgi:hypothetical protein
MNIYYIAAIWLGMALVLLGLGGLATAAGSEAVLPAYLAGLAVAGVFLHDRILMDRLRSIAFAVLTPFFFLHAGTPDFGSRTGLRRRARRRSARMPIPRAGPCASARTAAPAGVLRCSTPAGAICLAGHRPPRWGRSAVS